MWGMQYMNSHLCCCFFSWVSMPICRPMSWPSWGSFLLPDISGPLLRFFAPTLKPLCPFVYFALSLPRPLVPCFSIWTCYYPVLKSLHLASPAGLQNITIAYIYVNSCLDNDIQILCYSSTRSPRKSSFLLPTLHIKRQTSKHTSKSRILTLETRETTGTKTLVSRP